jgi:DNA-binding response OmpR family regulator
MSGHRHILLLTEDAALATLLPPRLAQESAAGRRFDAEAMAPVAGLARLAEAAGRIDATLLDAAAPPSPAHWAAPLREAGGGRPVLLLGGEGALPEGITDRIAKPVRVPELLARLHALVAVFEASPEAAIALPGYAFHPAAKLLERSDCTRIRLTEKEAAILLYLHRAGGRAVPRAELLGEVWGYSSAVTTHTLETHVYRLRRKIEADPQAARLLVTDEGGYRLGGLPSAQSGT